MTVQVKPIVQLLYEAVVAFFAEHGMGSLLNIVWRLELHVYADRGSTI